MRELAAADLALFDADRADDRAAFRASMVRHRQARRWSQETLAAVAGLHHSLVSRLESGARNPTRDSLAKLCAALDLDGAARDELHIQAGYTPPGLDLDTLARLVTAARAATREAA
jgi:transcriptional regulator with XRE-family HTH domain